MTDRPQKRCFVTVGATAAFIGLIRAVLESSFLECLKTHGYTELRIQFGKNGKKTFDDYLWVLSDEQRANINITGFDFKQNGLKDEMLAVRGRPNGTEGCVISHAGKHDSCQDALLYS